MTHACRLLVGHTHTHKHAMLCMPAVTHVHPLVHAVGSLATEQHRIAALFPFGYGCFIMVLPGPTPLFGACAVCTAACCRRHHTCRPPQGKMQKALQHESSMSFCASCLRC